MGSTGPGQSYNSSPPPPQGGVKGLGGIGGPTLASPRKQQGQPGPGMASLRGPMLGASSNQLMAGGGGPGGQHIVLPGMASRGRGGTGNDEYGIGGRSMGPNGHTVEPLIKRPRYEVVVLFFPWVVFPFLMLSHGCCLARRFDGEDEGGANGIVLVLNGV